MTTPKDDLEMRIEDFEHYYRNTFVVDNCGEFTRVRELTVDLIKDREKMKAAIDYAIDALQWSHDNHKAIPMLLEILRAQNSKPEKEEGVA